MGISTLNHYYTKPYPLNNRRNKPHSMSRNLAKASIPYVTWKKLQASLLHFGSVDSGMIPGLPRRHGDETMHAAHHIFTSTADQLVSFPGNLMTPNLTKLDTS